MLIPSALGAIGIGLIMGRLYPAMSLLLVSPLVGAVAGVAASGEARSPWQSVLFGLLAVFLFQVAYLAGLRLRSSFKRSGAAKSVVAVDEGTAAGADRSGFPSLNRHPLQRKAP